jgi:hypothetical protein
MGGDVEGHGCGCVYIGMGSAGSCLRGTGAAVEVADREWFEGHLQPLLSCSSIQLCLCKQLGQPVGRCSMLDLISPA